MAFGTFIKKAFIVQGDYDLLRAILDKASAVHTVPKESKVSESVIEPFCLFSDNSLSKTSLMFCFATIIFPKHFLRLALGQRVYIKLQGDRELSGQLHDYNLSH